MKVNVDIQIYESENGKSPYLLWESKLNRKARAVITARLVRIRMGNFGDCKSIQGIKGLYELRIHFESGYRIYFGKYKEKIILLLTGGDKGSQKRDIQKTNQYATAHKVEVIPLGCDWQIRQFCSSSIALWL